MNISNITNNVKMFLTKNSSTILTVLSLAGVVGTVATASQDTRKAEDIITTARPRNKKEELKLTWKCYIPTAISAGTTMACILGSHYCSQKQKEALGSAYALSQLTLQKYQEKVIERIGKNKAEVLREDVMNEVAECRDPSIGFFSGMTKPIDTGHGNTLFYLIPAKLWFYSDKNFLDAQTNAMNHDVMTEMFYDGNEIMYRWGLPFDSRNSEWIFTAEDMFEPHYEAKLMDNGQVRVNIDYELISMSEWKKRGR